MNIIPITSFANPLLKKIRGLHARAQREKTQLFLLEGTKLINEALDKGIALKEIVVSRSFLKAGLGQCLLKDIAGLFLVDDSLYAQLTTVESPEGIIATASVAAYDLDHVLTAKTNPLFLVAVGIQDPGNLGTMFRTALAASASGVILTKGTVDPYNPKVIRSASGAHFSLPIIQEASADVAIAMLKKHGLTVLICDPRGDKPYWEFDLTKPCALIFGNEGQGFSPPTIALADDMISIPMNKECESLNVAVAAGIILFRAKEKRFLSPN